MYRFMFMLAIVTGWIGVVLTAGCTPHAGRVDLVTADEYPQISVLDDLSWKLVFDKPIVEQGNGRPLNVTVPVRVVADSGIAIQYRFEFLDELGRPLQPDMQWRYAQLPGRNQRFLQGSALDTAAVDWRFEARRAQ